MTLLIYFVFWLNETQLFYNIYIDIISKIGVSSLCKWNSISISKNNESTKPLFWNSKCNPIRIEQRFYDVSHWQMITYLQTYSQTFSLSH